MERLTRFELATSSLTKAKQQLETTQEEMRTAKQEAEKEFPKEQELREKAARLQELNSLLNIQSNLCIRRKCREYGRRKV